MLLGACAILIGQKNPSGNPSPSSEDAALTSRLTETGKLLGISVLDNVVWTRDGAYHSFAEAGALPG